MSDKATVFTVNLTRRHDLVKVKIMALGVRLGDLAVESGLSAQSLSKIIHGSNRNRAAQTVVARALRDMSGCRKVTRQYLFGQDGR